MSELLRVLPSFDELDALDVHEREDFLAVQIEHDLNHGGDFVRRYRRWQKRCSFEDPDTGERCGRDRLSPSQGTRCSEHFDLKDWDPSEWAKARAVTAKVRMAELLDKAVSELEGIIDDEDVPAQVRLKAVTEVMDRSGVPRTQTVQLEAEVEVTDKTSAAEVVRERLRQLAVPVRSEVTTDTDTDTAEEPPQELTG